MVLRLRPHRDDRGSTGCAHGPPLSIEPEPARSARERPSDTRGRGKRGRIGPTAIVPLSRTR